MSVIDEIESLAQKEVEVFESPDVVYLGRSKYNTLMREMSGRAYTPGNPPAPAQPMSIQKIWTCAGPLVIKVVETPANLVQVGDNVILKILRKLGLKWDHYEKDLSQ